MVPYQRFYINMPCMLRLNDSIIVYNFFFFFVDADFIWPFVHYKSGNLLIHLHGD